MSCGHPEDPGFLLPGETLEDFVSRYMSQFQYEETRHLETTSSDLSNLENAFLQIKDIIKRVTNGLRLDSFMHILSLTSKIHHSIYCLRQYKRNPSLKNETFNDYVIQVKIALDELLRDSYEDEKRKLEVIFGKYILYTYIYPWNLINLY
uniref:Uncharacterized protein n=1 Tax=Panagrolaimus superbus TaxID=310955 RepID=A0A914Y963_9BILA